MAIQEYTLSTIRDEVLDEFGLDTTDATLKTKGNTVINLAQAFITNSRPDWPWRMGDLALDIGASVQDVGTFTLDSATVGSITGARAALEIFTVEADITRPLTGYVCKEHTAGAGNDGTITSNYRGTTAVAAAFTVSTGFVALPSDFSRLKVARMVQDGAEPVFQYVTPLALKEIKFKSRQIDLFHQFYTVIPDPITTDVGTSTMTFYIELYPYVTTRSLIAGSYWRDTPQLDTDTEVPRIPREDRITLISGSQWYLGRYLKVDDQRLKDYRVTFFSMLGSMREFYNLSDDPGERSDRVGDPVDWIQGPAGFPEFGENNMVV